MPGRSSPHSNMRAGARPRSSGKPASAFFNAALASLGIGADAAVMVGDDVDSDVGGPMAAGLRGILVRTGKYRAGDETTIDPAPTAVANDLSEAVAWILDTR